MEKKVLTFGPWRAREDGGVSTIPLFKGSTAVQVARICPRLIVTVQGRLRRQWSHLRAALLLVKCGSSKVFVYTQNYSHGWQAIVV